MRKLVLFLFSIIIYASANSGALTSIIKKEINENLAKKIRVMDLSPIQEKLERSIMKVHDIYDPYKEPLLGMKYLQKEFEKTLSHEDIKTLRQMGNFGQPSIVHFKNSPIDKNIPISTEINHRLSLKNRVSENFILGIAGCMNCNLGVYSDMQKGSIIHNVTPVQKFFHTASSRGIDPFYLHAEMSFKKTQPDFLMLLCLENDPGAFTTMFDIGGMLNELDSTTLKAMHSSSFKFTENASVDSSNEDIFPLLSKDTRGRLRLRLYEEMDRLKGITIEAKQALSILEDKFKEERQKGKVARVSLEKVDALIFNNAWGYDNIEGIMHGRDGKITNLQRWLQRAYFMQTDEIHRSMLDKQYQNLMSSIKDVLC